VSDISYHPNVYLSFELSPYNVLVGAYRWKQLHICSHRSSRSTFLLLAPKTTSLHFILYRDCAVYVPH
jgi:hypothetical protein